MSVSDVDRVELLLAEGMKTLNLKSRIDTEHESDTEAWVNLVDLGVSVFCDAEGGTRRSIGGFLPVPSFQVYTAATHWELEATDMVIAYRNERGAHVLRSHFDRVDSAVAEVFAIVVKDTIFSMIEATTII